VLIEAVSVDDLRAPGAILLVSCYELGHPPLGAAWPAAFLEARGFRPAIADVSLVSLPDAVIRRARLVAIATPMHTAVAIGTRVATRVRAIAPRAHIAFLGLYAVLNRAHLQGALADSILGGELEEELVALAESLERGRPIARERPLDRLRFAPPSRAGLEPLERYAKLVVGGEKRLAAAVETSRGCKHRCRHCPIPPVYEGRVFVVPEDIVLADVEAVVRQGARHVTFSDPDFLNAPRHAGRVAAAVHRAFPEVTFDCTAKISHLTAHAPLVAELAQNGCAFIVSAVESLSDRVLAILDKGHTRADVTTALDVCERAGVALRPSLLPFTPWSTRGDYLDLLSWIDARDLAMHVDPVQLAVRLLVPPGSLLEAHPEMRPHLAAFEPDAFSWRWNHPDPSMDALAERANQIVADAADRAAMAEAGEGATPDAFETFAELAGAAGAEIDFAAARRRHQARARDIPRLTEPWFC
jgi:radical SAM superfamily enzyme YgiQ (UPF0313 family)